MTSIYRPDNGFAISFLPPFRRRRNGHYLEPRRVTGRNLAHVGRTTSQRAALGAERALGHVRLERPTIKQICAILHVSVPYLRLALTLSEKTRARVLEGRVSLSDAARANGLAAAYFGASSDVKVAAGRTIGPAAIWDEMVAPCLTTTD